MFTAPDHPPQRHPQSRGLTLLEVVVGLAVGIMPGLGGIAGMSLLMPFIYGMDPEYELKCDLFVF